MTLTPERALEAPERPPEIRETPVQETNVWWVVAVAGLVAVAIFVAWLIAIQPPTLPDSVTGFDYDHEVTPIQLATPFEPMTFVGIDANLDPDYGAVVGFDYDHEVTPIHIATLREPMPFVGQDANLDPAS